MAEYIDRKALLEEINTEERPGGDEVYAYYSCIFDIIDTLPAADVRPEKHGKWEKIDPNICSICLVGETAWQCSECKIEFTTSADDDLGFVYCPNCGAKMDGKDGDING